MNNECFLDILLKIPRNNMSLKLDESENCFQVTINLGFLNVISIQDESILMLKYSNGEIRLDIDPLVFHEFVVTQNKTMKGIKNGCKKHGVD